MSYGQVAIEIAKKVAKECSLEYIEEHQTGSYVYLKNPRKNVSVMINYSTDLVEITINGVTKITYIDDLIKEYGSLEDALKSILC